MKSADLRQLILRQLAAAQPYAVPVTTLLFEINRQVRPAIKPVDLAEHLTFFQTHDMADFMADAMAPDDAEARKWFIKEAGLAASRS